MASLIIFIALILTGLWFGAQRYPNKALQWTRKLYANWAQVDTLFTPVSGLKQHAYWRLAPSTDKDAPWIVMLHGFSADKTVWCPFARHLPKEYSLLMVDLTGHGDSEVDDNCQFDMKNQALRLIKLLDNLGIAECHLVGNSMGGQLTAYMATHFAERCLSAYLFNPSGIIAPKDNAFSRAILAGRNPFFGETYAEFEHFYQQTMAKPPWVPAPILNAIYSYHQKRRPLLKRVFAEFTASHGSFVPKTSCPTCICWGELDDILDISALPVWQQHLPQASTRVYTSIGHMPMLECPKLAAADYGQFLTYCQFLKSSQ
ncbi:alpha/beta hydrolase [Shewanella sp. SNU WT4]|uniref:alpha/beta fold hydrolase n=1 Tax=Shewanella sp. SNU WT4 TaxID=2590015 RepID=UPI001128DF92|nr:alpha/beta hydrolase [Shewanella sp. SNU WT4]QDF66594.1 alpha/beta hydrolase [Shewanella sp. SNU WT4]